MLNLLKKLFKRQKPKLKLGSCYGVLHGHYVGELFVFIEEREDTLCFLSIPNMKNREVPRLKYNYAIKNNVIEYVEMLPRNERKVCKAQYQANEDEKHTNN